jgi:NAD(P)-dependent dehydrogenase (short-subunit alcohol dehydrogenase family)
MARAPRPGAGAIMSAPVPDLAGRIALVVAASRGLGAAAARAFAAAAVVLVARIRVALEALAADIRAGGGRASALTADVTSAEAMQAVVDQTLAEYGRLDFAVNNANDTPRPVPLADVDPADFQHAIATSVLGTFHGMRAQLPAMLATLGNHPDAAPAIVNTASVAGLNAVPNLGPYVAGATHRILALPRQAQDAAASTVPMQRLDTTTEITDAILWLCSPAASFVTGTVIPIDAGQSIAQPQRPPATSLRASSPITTIAATAPDPGQL